MSGVGGVGQTPDIQAMQPGTEAPNVPSKVGAGTQQIVNQLTNTIKFLKNELKWSASVNQALQSYKSDPSPANLAKLKKAVQAFQGLINESKAIGASPSSIKAEQQVLQRLDQLVENPTEGNLQSLSNAVNPNAQMSIAYGAAQQLHAINQGLGSVGQAANKLMNKFGPSQIPGMT